MKTVFYFLTFVIASLALFFFLRTNPTEVQVYEISLGSFEDSLSANAIIRSKNRQTLFSFATGDLDPIQKEVGDMVSKNEVLSRLQWDQLYILKSPLNGVISKIYRKSGGPVTRGEPLLEISDFAQLEVSADVLTTDAVRLSQGTLATLTNWGGSGELKTKVRQVSRAGVIKISALGVEEERTEVLMDLGQVSSEVYERLGDNYHVEVKFLISKIENVLTVPLGALFKIQEDWACFVIEKNRASLRRLRISKLSDNNALIEEGLRLGDKVILFPGDQVQDGTPVRGQSK
jgi:HlyD family secretion protein